MDNSNVVNYEDEEVIVSKPKQGYSVGIYLVDQAFGGNEEGGWWYDTGELQKQFWRYSRYFLTEDEAYSYCRRINDWLHKTINRNRRPISSVLSEGIFECIVFDGFNLPEYFPEKRPHYE